VARFDREERDGPKRRALHLRRRDRRIRALARQGLADVRSAAAQLTRLDTLLGVGVGARKERERLTAQL
jgi:hypothetical protein